MVSNLLLNIVFQLAYTKKQEERHFRGVIILEVCTITAISVSESFFIYEFLMSYICFLRNLYRDKRRIIYSKG